MPKVKISEYSATANSNTDVASINIDEGCAPSGINNAIRAVMGHLKDFQQGTYGDPFNGPVNGTLGATTANTANVTTLTTSSTVTHNGGTINGVAYLNGAKVLTTGSALTFNGSALAVTGTLSTTSTTTVAAASGGQFFKLEPNTGLTGIRRTWAFNPEFSASGQLSVMVGASEGAAPSIEVLKLTSTSLAVLGLTDISAATAGQIKFPATQNASSNANTLDDYEEGTWVVTFTAGTSGTITLNSSNNELSYIKIGSQVTIFGRVLISSVSSPVGSIQINLPFAAEQGLADQSDFYALPVMTHDVDLSAGAVTVFAESSNANYLVVYQTIDNAAWVALPAANLKGNGNEYFYITGSYRAA